MDNNLYTHHTNEDVEFILKNWPAKDIKELADFLNMTEQTIKHVLIINGKLPQHAGK